MVKAREAGNMMEIYGTWCRLSNCRAYRLTEATFAFSKDIAHAAFIDIRFVGCGLGFQISFKMQVARRQRRLCGQNRDPTTSALS